MAGLPDDARRALLGIGALAQPDIDQLHAALSIYSAGAQTTTASVLVNCVERERARVVVVPAGATVHEPEEAGSHYVVLQGLLSAYSCKGGATSRLRTLGPGELFGEIGHVSGEPPHLIVRADVQAVLLELDCALVEELYQSNRLFRENVDRFYRETRSQSRSRDDASGPDDVHLGTAAPHGLREGQRFVARFMAYTDPHRETVLRIVEAAAPRAEARPGLERCAWQRGARVDVRLTSPDAAISSPTRSFRWNGSWHILRFDARVRSGARNGAVVLRFDIAVEGLPLARLCPEIPVRAPGGHDEAAERIDERPAPRSAFASYANADRYEVLGRVRSLEVVTGIDVFVDCLSMKPGERWKRTLRDEIRAREVFWLFWSREAMRSRWVDWEWRTAVDEKSIDGIQPHPLEPAELAPPPDELAELQFGSAHEWYVTHLRPRRFAAPLRRLCRRLLERVRTGRRQRAEHLRE